jgi:hypothetical protein
MNVSCEGNRYVTKAPGVLGVLGVTAAATLLLGVVSSSTASAQPAQPNAPAPAFDSQDAWRDFMAQVPKPQKGCFTAAYPDITWHEVPCGTPPRVPYGVGGGRASQSVGAGFDYSATVSGHISMAVGSFDSVQGVKRELTNGGTYSLPIANAFSLQLNSEFFTTPACSGATHPSNCFGFQQFVLSNFQSNTAFMQYWLINYEANCPGGWTSGGSGAPGDCYQNSSSVQVPAQKIKDLRNLSVTGMAQSGGTDTLIISTGAHLYAVQGEDSVLDLALGWQIAEFNIFGDCCSSVANFNDGSTLVVKTRVKDGSAAPPGCLNQSFTAETNNLTLFKTCAILQPGLTPAIMFTESNASRLPVDSPAAANGN